MGWTNKNESFCWPATESCVTLSANWESFFVGALGNFACLPIYLLPALHPKVPEKQNGGRLRHEIALQPIA